ncbi:PRC-barrel domain-containing protein [Rhodobacter sp. 24-YEA-8]|uniref:PRC-barrel domain-containing protein n=1 Tax=Rhodobacter sp. 24-YEA-8 TaxID=1884310 RepID=UPI00089A11DB|nr:PRC-barrel domain-containing protein [Rhodobacter sp. 24-YEA-8]SED59917.1 PRC-barrel domain-containing protein [Rhodobacter sp. 24-YEA-8]
MTTAVPGYEATTAHLISGKDDVKGTRVYSPAGDDLGHIDDVMIDPASGKVVYGVLQFGGFLGIGSDYHPIPFGKLRYDGARGVYVTDLTKAQLEGAPAYSDDWRSNRDWQKRSYDHYGVNPYWL